MQQRKQHTAFAVNGYAITASLQTAKCGSAPSCKADFTIFLCQQYGKNSSGDILAIPPEQRDNNSGGSPYVP